MEVMIFLGVCILVVGVIIYGLVRDDNDTPSLDAKRVTVEKDTTELVGLVTDYHEEIHYQNDYSAALWVDIVGESFYQDNINKLTNGGFYNARLTKSSWNGELAYKIMIAGMQVGSVGRSYIPTATHILGSNKRYREIRVIVHNDNYPNVKMFTRD